VNITGGTVVATDSILTAFGKLQNQINGLIGSSIYQGVWNAATNTPTLQSGVGVRGYYYIVNVAGTTNLDGITDWFVGDWAIFDGTAWQQVDNTDAVVSVNGQTGAVSLTTDNIPEGATNQYFLNSRARAALSFTAGSGAYNSTTGVITIPTNTSQLTNGANFITLASLSGTAPIQYNSSTGAISITQSGTSSNGFLSSTDWNTFNNKQNALTNPVTGTGTTNYLPKFTGASTIGNSNVFDNGTNVGIGTASPNFLLTLDKSSSYTLGLLNSNIGTVGQYTGLTFGYTGSSYQKGAIYFVSRDGAGRGNLQFALEPSNDSSNVSTSNTKMTLNYEGNLGLGVTPSPSSLVRAFDIAANGQFFGDGALYDYSTGIIQNGYRTGNTTWAYKITGVQAARFELNQSEHRFYTAGGGTAGGAISWTQAMTLDASGRLGIGLTSMLGRLHIKSSGFSSYPLLVQRNANTNNIFYIIEDADGDGILNLENSGGNANVQLHSNGVSYFNGGNVGIGSSSPSQQLTLGGRTTIQASLVSSTNTGASEIYFGDSDAVYRGYIGYQHNGDYFQFATAATERMRITSGGNVGIGTTSPSVKLDVQETATNTYGVINVRGNNRGGSIDFYNNTTFLGQVYADSSSNIVFGNTTSFTERMRITSSGNVSIGNTNDTFKLDVTGTGRFTSNLLAQKVQVGTAATINDATGVGNTLQFANYSAGVFVTGSADSYIYKTSSVFGGLAAQTLIFQTRSDVAGGGFAFVGGSTPSVIAKIDQTGAATFASLAGTGNRMVVADANGLLSTQAIGSGSITGSGTTNYLPKFTGTSTIGNSIVQDASTYIDVAGYAFFRRGGKYIILNPNVSNANSYADIGVDSGMGITFTPNAGSAAMTLTSSGNLGLGVTPSAWASGYKAFQFGNSSTETSAFFSNGVNDFWAVSNAYFDGTNFKYVATGTSTGYEQFNGSHKWYQAGSGTAGNAITFTQAMTLNASGNLGLGVTPSAWGTVFTKSAFQFGGSVGVGALWTNSFNNGVFLGNNIYDDGAGNNRYIINGNATEYSQASGQHIWKTAPSGTAGNAISFTQAMTLNASGNLSLGNTNDTYKLDVSGTGRFSGTSLILGSNGNGNTQFTINSTTGTAQRIAFQVAGTDQWLIGNGAASQTTNFEIYNTTGTIVYSVNRTTNAATFTGAATFSSSIDMGLNRVFSGGGYKMLYRNSTVNITYSGTSNWQINNDADNVALMTVLNGGNVGIGTTSPTNKLDVSTPNKASVLGSTSAINVDYTTSTIGEYQTIGFSYSSSVGNRNQYWGMGFTATSFAAGLGDVFFFTGGAERARITSGGNVGIGTNAPNSLLEVNKTITFSSIDTYAQLIVKTTSGATGRLLNIGVDETNSVSFIQSLNRGTDAMPLSLQRYGGNVGIGTISPAYRLEVQNTTGDSHMAAVGTAPSLQLMSANTGPANWATIGMATASNHFIVGAVAGDFCISNRGTTAGNMLFGFGSSEKMRLTSNGDLCINATATTASAKLYVNGTAAFGSVYVASLGTGTVYSNAGTLTNTNPSDRRLKNNIIPLTYGLSDILKLNPVSYNWKDGTNGKQFGFIAQEVQEIMPDAVKQGEYLGLEKDAIYSALVNAIKEQQAQINDLKSQLNK
jgi:hypothetical protein